MRKGTFGCWKKLNKLILNPPFEENLGRSSPNEARTMMYQLNGLKLKEKDLNSNESDFFTVSCEYIYI